jgi:hypothetical protein
MTSRKVLLLLVLALVLAVAADGLVNECHFIGGMGSSEKTCDCLGAEVLLYDRKEADGPRKTVCLGIVRSVECYQYRDGPRVPCAP